MVCLLVLRSVYCVFIIYLCLGVETLPGDWAYFNSKDILIRGVLSLRTLDWGVTPQKGLFRVRLLDILDDFRDLGLRKMILRCREHVWL